MSPRDDPRRKPQPEETETDSVQIAIPDEQTFIVRNLLNYEAPHYFARFTIVGCPPGLEILDKYEHLVVNRRQQNEIDLDDEKRLYAYSQFDIKNSRGMQLYIAVEKVKASTLTWMRDARLFEVSFYDFHCRKAFTVRRKCGLKYCFAQYPCLFCTTGFKGCGNYAEVLLSEDGTRLGTIKQKLSLSSTILYIYNKKGKCEMIVDGIVADGILDVTYPDDEEPIAMIETLLNEAETFDFYRVNVPRYSSPYGITFFKNFITPEQKAMLLSVVILLDFITLKTSGDYPDLAEVIPNDFQEHPLPHSKLRRDGSKDLVIMTERRRRKRHHKRSLKGRWGCCIWCTQLLCFCWLLWMKRNTLRCFGLVIVIVAALVLLVFLIIHIINGKYWNKLFTM